MQILEEETKVGRLEGPVAVASPGGRGPGQIEAGGEFYGGVADGSGCWDPALGRGSEEAQGMEPQGFGEAWGSLGILSLAEPAPHLRSQKQQEAH